MRKVMRVTLGSALLVALGACKSAEQKAAEAVAEGRAALRRGNLVEAGQAFDRAQALKPGNADAALGNAEVSINRHDGERALDILDTCSAEPACQALSQQVLSGWLEAGQRSPLTAQAAKQLVLALRRREGEKCGLLAAIAHAAHLKPEQGADRALLRETVRAEIGEPIEVSDAEPNASLLRAAAAAGKLAGSEDGCDAARRGETGLLGRMTTLARMQGAAPDALGLGNLGASLSRIYWSNALHERLRVSESTPAADAAGATTPAPTGAAASAPQGPGCDAFQKCCDDIGVTMSTAVVCPLQLSKYGNCDEARRQMGLLFAASGGELPSSCK